MIDSHCHLADRKFSRDLANVIARARDADVHRMICIADDLAEAQRCRDIAEAHEEVFFTAGVHPHHASDWREDSVDLLASFLEHPRCRAVGEIGLDYHYMNSPKEAQKFAFSAQLSLARERGVPVVTHCRDAVDDVWEIVDAAKPEKLVLHCCTEKWEDVTRFVERGYLLSFTGIATYPNADVIRDTITHCPLSQMMIETDAPYLSPVPHRGKRNEPAFVIEVARLIAHIKNMPLEEVVAMTTRNAVEFFSLPS